jgi:predicted GH43/DUF377 family glycosyl hydrolase
MFKWEKKGRIFAPEQIQKAGWMEEYAQAPSVLIYDNFVRVYFCCRPHPDANGQYVSYMAYVDLNRSNLFEIIDVSEEPILQLGELGTFDEFGTYPTSVIRSGNDIRVYYGSFARCESVPFNAAIGVAKSYDNGKTFSKLGPGPVLSYSADEPFVLGSPKIRKFDDKWYLWYCAGKKWMVDNGNKQPVYKIRMAISDDGIVWKKLGKDILESILEENECQASADVIFENGKYHMFFSYRYNFGFKTAERGYRMGYAYSLDLVNWHREDDKAGLTESADGWDSESVSYGHVFKLDGKIYMLHQGNQMGKTGFGLAELTGELI